MKNIFIFILLLLFVSACGNTNTKWSENPDKLVGVNYSNYSPCVGKDSAKWNNCAGKLIKSQWKLGYDPLGLFNLYIDDELIAVYHNGIKKGPFESMIFSRGGKAGAQGYKIICNGLYSNNRKNGYETCTKTFYKEGRFSASRDYSKDSEVSKNFYIDGRISADPEIEKLEKKKRRIEKERLRERKKRVRTQDKNNIEFKNNYIKECEKRKIKYDEKAVKDLCNNHVPGDLSGSDKRYWLKSCFSQQYQENIKELIKLNKLECQTDYIMIGE